MSRRSMDLELHEGETLAVVGESGCGKSVTSLSVLRLIPTPPGKIESGEILFRGEDLLKKTEKEMRRIRGNEISMIFQEPLTSLNPVFTVGRQISESLILHRGMRKKDAHNEAIRLLKLVGLPNPEKTVNDYPHQLSGGMRQRVMIAMALSDNPKLIIADEPTGNLDPATAWEIMTLLEEINRRGTTIVMVTHAKDIVDRMKKRVVTINQGRIVRDDVGAYALRSEKPAATEIKAAASQGGEADE